MPGVATTFPAPSVKVIPDGGVQSEQALNVKLVPQQSQRLPFASTTMTSILPGDHEAAAALLTSA